MIEKNLEKLSSEALEEALEEAYRGANCTADDPWQDGMNEFWNARIREIKAEKNRREQRVSDS